MSEYKEYFEKRTDKEYQRYNFEHSIKVLKRRVELGIEKDIPFKGSESRTYYKIPNLKVYDFLRKAFEECEWSKIKRFYLKSEPQIEQHVDCLYYDFCFGGYVLMVLYHNHLENGNKSHGTIIVKNISSFWEEVGALKQGIDFEVIE